MPPPGSPLRVALDARGLVDGSRRRGIGTYLRNLMAGLAAREDVLLDVLGPGRDEVPSPATAVPLRRRLPLGMVPSSAARLALERAELEARAARALGRLDVAVLHSAGHEPPRAPRVPFVQTILDLTPLVFDHPLLARERRRWVRLAPRVRAAAAVVVPSRSSADQVTQLMEVPADRVHVVPLAVDPELAAPPEQEPAAPGAPYLLAVSAWGPHKGFRDASAVVARLGALGYPHRLVIAGAMDDWQRRMAWEDVVAGGGSSRTDLRGFVDDLAGLYRGAAVVLSPSRAEGFGLPVLEAMTVGSPVVAFANTSQIEVVGDGGALVADGDVEAMADAARALIDDAGARAEAQERAMSRAAAFSWEESVEAQVGVYRLVAGG